MDVIIGILKGYFIFTIIVMVIYTIRHMIFSYNRTYGRQKMSYGDVYSSKMPKVSVLIPMHNEEKVLHFVLDSLLKCNYDRDKLEIIPINDNSTDKTKELLEEYHKKYPFITPIHRDCPNRGKPAGLNDAMKIATGDIVVVFDADYRPSKDLINQLAISFLNAEVGAVMGRVIPYNVNKNLLTRLLNVERSGGYQADQQARYNLNLMPQYGGTVGGFRRSLMMENGGFNPNVLAEDTELTYRFYTQGWKVLYANSAECYEESPEDWKVRGKQIRRWSRGHNNVMFRYVFKLLVNTKMKFREKLDGILLLFIYSVPFILGVALIDMVLLFFLGEISMFAGWIAFLIIGAYNTFGNFAPFYEIGAAMMMDGHNADVKLLPLLSFNFYFYTWHISLGYLDAIADLLSAREVKWVKTVRFTTEEKSQGNEE